MKLKVFFNLTKPLFSLFSLPFLLAQAELSLLSCDSLNKNSLLSLKMLTTFLIALGAFFCARFGGMIVNAVIDADIDGKNPRTTQRAIPQRLVSTKNALAWVVGFLSVSLCLCLVLGIYCFIFSFLAILLIVSYPYTKHLSSFCHFFLGCIYLLAMLIVSMIIKNSISISDVLLGFSAFLVVSANDIMYAIQDMDFDQKEKLHSIPAKWGRACSKRIAQISLAASFICFSLVGLTFCSSRIFFFLSVLPLSSILYTIYLYQVSSEQNLYKTFVLGNIVVPMSFFIAVTFSLIG
ncbi:UbiA-like polyprenyltransferase [Chlamydiifrater volucris]|uniref:UbiA-like polyprenyltransferase n=1 Tax=Chlamydiifrater volucris TaxID=2681470 RepID=UPI001BCBBD20|nr:UbiA-like polyprenyltransferase [Chlamydiifrater volucris]